MQLGRVMFHVYLFVCISAAIGATAIIVSTREKGCWCTKRSRQRGTCCFRDLSGQFCPGQCACPHQHLQGAHEICKAQTWNLETKHRISAISLGVIAVIALLGVLARVRSFCRTADRRPPIVVTTVQMQPMGPLAPPDVPPPQPYPPIHTVKL